MLRIDRLSLLNLGIEGEQESKVIEIDVTPWLKKMPGAAFAIVATRPGENAPYLAVSQLEDGVLKWTITAGDLGVAGKYGRCDIRAYETGADGTERIRKTAVILTTVGDTLPGTAQATVPEASKSWVDKVTAAADSIKALKAKAETLPAGADATAGYDAETGTMTIGVPRGADGQGAGDMTKAIYDKDGDGIVDKAADANKLGGKLPNAYALAQHSHAQSDVTGLTDALAGKAATQHSHAQGDVTGLTDALAGKAAAQHTHAQSDITGLTTTLTGLRTDIDAINADIATALAAI